jgi:hypothetical protein
MNAYRLSGVSSARPICLTPEKLIMKNFSQTTGEKATQQSDTATMRTALAHAQGSIASPSAAATMVLRLSPKPPVRKS